jgi:FMN phosphatase YigB (HAD superfamily)
MGEGAYGQFFEQPEERERWIGEMCEIVDVSTPPFNECVALAEAAEDYVLPRVRSAFPEVVDAVRGMAARGHRLYTASGQTQRELEGYLSGMGLRDLFGEHLYGPDVVRAMKRRREYYERIFAHAGIDARGAVVLDDSADQVRLARSVGAHGVLVARDGANAPDDVPAIRDLSELAAAIEALG